VLVTWHHSHHRAHEVLTTRVYTSRFSCVHCHLTARAIRISCSSGLHHGAARECEPALAATRLPRVRVAAASPNHHITAHSSAAATAAVTPSFATLNAPLLLLLLLLLLAPTSRTCGPACAV
jgi:hypothetical protein